jgi:glycosyltransferase involved in cell wall biosynthesis
MEVTVILPTHTEDRWDSLVTAVRLVEAQQPPPYRVVVAVDHNPVLLERVRAELPTVVATENHYAPGASGTRNSGAEQAETPILAFLDSDVRPRENWLAALVAPFADPSVLGTGGFVAPAWVSGRPRWFPDEFLWVVGATFHPADTPRRAVRNVWSENMAVRRVAFWQVNGFRLDFGKVGDRSSPEDTDLCLRMRRAHPGQSWMLVTEAIVDHAVGPERSTVSFYLRRCFSEGLTKVQMARLNSGGRELGDEYSYMKRVVSTSLWTYLKIGLNRHDLTALRRLLAVIGGLAAATAGAAIAFPVLRRR